MITFGILYNRIAPEHISHGESVVYSVAREISGSKAARVGQTIHLRVQDRIALLDAIVVPTAHNGAINNEHGADGNAVAIGDPPSPRQSRPAGKDQPCSEA